MEEDNTQYFNDEWNGQWIKDPLKFPECSPESLEVNRNKKAIENLQLEYNKTLENLSRVLLERTGNMKFSEIGKDIKTIK